jgi:hypothetical protein
MARGGDETIEERLSKLENRFVLRRPETAPNSAECEPVPVETILPRRGRRFGPRNEPAPFPPGRFAGCARWPIALRVLAC